MKQVTAVANQSAWKGTSEMVRILYATILYCTHPLASSCSGMAATYSLRVAARANPDKEAKLANMPLWVAESGTRCALLTDALLHLLHSRDARPKQ